MKPPDSMITIGATVRPDHVAYLTHERTTGGTPASYIVRAALDLYITNHPLAAPSPNATIAASS